MTPKELSIHNHELLAQHTTLGVGGPARFWATPTDEEELIASISWSQQEKLPLIILGGGSNVVISDQGIEGLVLRWDGSDITIVQETDEAIHVKVQGGCAWDRLVEWSVERGISSIACLSGIPGQVGGAVIQNLGAYGQEISQVLSSASILTLDTLTVEDWSKKRFCFGYRYSILKPTQGQKHLVLDATFNLPKSDESSITHAGLARVMGTERKIFSSKEIREQVLALRKSKSMVVDPKDPNSKSVGSFFTNPILSKEEWSTTQKRLCEAGVDLDNLPCYPQAEGAMKLAAAWLIEYSGLKRGTSWERVGLSEVHALAIVNRNKASTQDIVKFAAFIQDEVEKHTGVLLQPEAVFLGFENHPLRTQKK